MAISRIIAVDPSPRLNEGDIIVYQVPEHSRAEELLCEMLEARQIEWAKIEAKQRNGNKETPT